MPSLMIEKHMLSQIQMLVDLGCTQLLNLQCQPQCTARTCNSSHDISLSVSYIFEGTVNLNYLCVGQ